MRVLRQLRAGRRRRPHRGRYRQPGPGQYNPGNAPQFINCAFIGNRSNNAGGAFCNSQAELTVSNCLFSGNTSIGTGALFIGTPPNGGIIVTTKVLQCTFSANESETSGLPGGLRAGGTTIVDGAIFWGNLSDGSPSQITVAATDSSVQVRYSNVQGGWANTSPNGNNINADPLFVDADGADNVIGTVDDDVRLLCGSPSINTSSNALLPLDVVDLDLDFSMTEPHSQDLKSTKRIIAGIVDRGVMENDDNSDCRTGDTNGDNVVNVTDLLRVISDWGCTTGCPGDVAPNPCHDNAVNVTDLLAIISNWGMCPGECATGAIGEAGAIPESYYDCQDMCSGLSGDDWAHCMQKCFHVLCSQGQTEFCDP